MKTTPAPALQFTHLHAENWKNFGQVDVDLRSRVFLVGPNASGKSNLLDLFRFLRDIVAVGGGLQEAVRRRDGVSRLRCLAARRYSDLAICVTLGRPEQPPTWQYELVLGQDNRQRPVLKKERVTSEGQDILLRPDDADERDPERLTQTYLEQVQANQRFREVASFFGSVRYLHVVPQLVRDPDRSVGRRQDPFGGDFLEQIARTPEKTRKSRLGRIRAALRVAVPQLRELELQSDARGVPHLRGNYEHWRPQGAWQTEEQFSDGTLRLMGLLWALLDGQGPILLEEPELSLHPDVVRYIPQVFARLTRRTGRQLLVSTHSGDLLADDGISLSEVLLLMPRTEGTEVRPAAASQEIRALLDGGVRLPEAVLPRTAPRDAQELLLFEV
jgi:predicted ATPase